MAQQQQDIRITKTYKALEETMQALLQKKSFQKITVNDICQNAMVSRSTFYLHFEDKYQLLMFCLQNESERLKSSLIEKETKESILEALNIIKERKKVYYNIFMSEINFEVFQMFKSFFLQFISDTLVECEKRGVTLVGPIPILSAYYANGIAGTIVWWIKNNFENSIEEMASCLYKLLSDIIPN